MVTHRQPSVLGMEIEYSLPDLFHCPRVIFDNNSSHARVFQPAIQPPDLPVVQIFILAVGFHRQTVVGINEALQLHHPVLKCAVWPVFLVQCVKLLLYLDIIITARQYTSQSGVVRVFLLFPLCRQTVVCLAEIRQPLHPFLLLNAKPPAVFLPKCHHLLSVAKFSNEIMPVVVFFLSVVSSRRSSVLLTEIRSP